MAIDDGYVVAGFASVGVYDASATLTTLVDQYPVVAQVTWYPGQGNDAQPGTIFFASGEIANAFLGRNAAAISSFQILTTVPTLAALAAPTLP